VQGKILFAGGKHEVVRHITFDWTPHDAGDGEAIDYDKRTVALKEAEAMSSCSNSART
jgi:hypothetical protein